MADILSQLVEMTRTLGQPHLDYVIIGEGNTSARIDEASFWIKASGQGMEHIGRMALSRCASSRSWRC